MITILTDSTADLGATLADRYQIQIIPLYVVANNQVYTDGVDIDNAALFQLVAQTGQLPKTSAPSVADFKQWFAQPGEHVYIGLSSQLSTTLQNALLAQQACEPGKVFVIDSRNLSSGIGLLALKAADLRAQGLPAAEIAAQVSQWVPRVRTSFVIETLEYLYKGGRCSAMQNLMGSLLRLRPVIAVRPDGTLGVKAKTRGSRRKALDSLLGDFIDRLPQIHPQRVFVTHTGSQADAEYLKAALLATPPIEEVHITLAGSVIASHCGPDTIGILYFEK